VIAFLDRIVPPRALLAGERVRQKDVRHREHGLPHGRASGDAMPPRMAHAARDHLSIQNTKAIQINVNGHCTAMESAS
jgi:hypothetical protein